MRRPFRRIVLTGGIATGKSVCLGRFETLGARTIDADRLARELVRPGTPALAAIVDRFGSSIVQADGTLDRAALGAVVFADPQARRDLEQIIHPGVFRAIEAWFAERQAEAARSADPIVAIADIPLLYETGEADRFDLVLVAACRPAQQLERLMARDGLGPDAAARRIAAQIPIDEKRARADIVIDTSGSVEETLGAVDAAWQRLTG